jgi:hypothetical protein
MPMNVILKRVQDDDLLKVHPIGRMATVGGRSLNFLNFVRLGLQFCPLHGSAMLNGPGIESSAA